MTTSASDSHSVRRAAVSILMAGALVAGVAPTPVRGQAASTSPAATQALTPPAAQAPASAVSADASLPLDAPLPPVDTVLAKVRTGLRLDRELQTQYTYLERRRDVKLSKLGKVMVGPERTFEVYPSSKPGRTYKRLVAVDGTPLPRADLERRDEEHRQHVLSMVEAEKNETPDAKAKRLKKDADDQREERELIDDGFAVYDIKLVGRELFEGRRVLVATMTPRPNAKTKTDEGGWMKKFKGRAWVSEDDYQIAKLEMEAVDDITIGLGLLGRVHEGSRFTFHRTKVNNEAWLPVEAKFEASGRTLLFRKFQIFTVTSFSDYKKFNVDTTSTYDLPPKDSK